MMRVSTLILLCSVRVLAGGAIGTTQPTIKNPVTATPGTGLQTYYVDPTGNDNNACTGTGTAACLTIQGAINKSPKLLRDQVTVDIAAGTYAGFIVSGFSADNGVQQTTGGLLIDGKLANSTLATGSPTGTATSGTASSGSTWGTLCDTAAIWTTNDLTGRFIDTTSPSNTGFVIASNTGTCITIGGGLWAAPTGSTAYAIQDPTVVLSTGVSFPATPIFGASSNNTGIAMSGNSVNYRSASIELRRIRVASPTTNGVVINDLSNYRIEKMQIRPSSPATTGFSIGVQSDFGGTVSIFSSDISINSASANARAVFALGGFITLGNLRANNATNAGTAVLIGRGFGGSGVSGSSLSALDLSGFTNGISLDNARFADNVNGTLLTHITCGSSSGVGVVAGTIVGTTNQTMAPATFSSVRQTLFTTCGMAVQAIGSGNVDVISADGSVATTGFDARLGGVITYAKAGMTLTAGTNEINLDTGSATANFADITAGRCLAVTDTGSRVCAR